MSDLLEYKGFQGSIEYSKEDSRLFGKVLHIESLLSYHGASVEEINKAFIETIDAYLSFCEKTGRTPNKPYSGTFNVRLTPKLHKEAVELATQRGQRLNEFVFKTVESEVESHSKVQTQINAVWGLANAPTPIGGLVPNAIGIVANQVGTSTDQRPSIDIEKLAKQYT